MIRLGITGGIGSGKSTVCNIFTHLGVPVYNADERAKWLVGHDAAIRQDIIKAFGEEAFNGHTYNRAFVASIVFNDKARLEQLNAIIHPAVLADWDDFCRAHKDQAYVIKEAAIMLEAGGRKTLDKIILVYSPLETRISRLEKRDGLERQAILSRIESQMPEEEKLKLVDHVIYNDDEHSLIEQVRQVHDMMSNSGWMS